MPKEATVGELKLVQYLNEAYGKEKQLETVLQAQIKLAQKPALKKRLQDHLKETKDHARSVERRIKALGGKADASSLPGPQIASDAASKVASAANKAMAAAKGPVQALRGTSPADNVLRNMRDAFWNEAEEIAHYNVIEAVAEALGDKDTAKLAREIRRQEERMQKFLSKQIPQLVREVIKSEVPKDQRAAGAAADKASSSRSTRSSSSSRSSSSRSSSSGSRTRKAASSRSAKPASSRAKPTSSRAKSSSRSSSGSSATRRSSGGSRTRSSGGSSS
jgi:ferritin-like metal-binding protein YciE